MPLPAVQESENSRAPQNSVAAKRVATPTSAHCFKTVLITDSMLRHINNDDALGVNHQLKTINKRDSSGLKHDDLRQNIQEIRPDFIYIHLGVNDVAQDISPRETLKNLIDFKTFTDRFIGTKLILSLPLYTGDYDTNLKIMGLREIMKEFVRHFHDDNPHVPLKMKKIWLNANANFTKDGSVIQKHYGADGVHLSNTGKQIVLHNLRHHIHNITRVLQGKPPKERNQSLPRSH